jgi:hypothetical protein
VEKLIAVMGEEYAQSYEGRLYLAFEGVIPSTTKGQMNLLGRIILEVYPLEMRDRFGYEMNYFSGRSFGRWLKKSPWESMPEIPKNMIEKLKISVMTCSKKTSSAKPLLDLLSEDARRFVWSSLDTYKLLSVIHPDLSGGWKN